jgi:hypothetical protein
MTDENFDTETPEPIAGTPAPESPAAEGVTAAAEGLSGAEAPVDEATEGGEAPATVGEDGTEVRPREVIKGIHPELRCEDPECAPEFTELQFFSPEEAVKQKGKIMLFCARSGKKYFAPAPELQTWIAENKVAKAGRGRKDG